MVGCTAAATAQTVSIPDAGLDAAIRAALQVPAAPLTDQDLLRLTFLSANSRNITSLLGLEAARNLTYLDLRSNQLANLSFPRGLDKLSSLDLSFNPLTNCTFPDGLGSLSGLTIENAQLTNLSLSATMTNLGGLVLFGNRFSTLSLPAGLGRLGFLDLSANQLENLVLPAGLTALTQLELYGNQLRTLALPADMTNLVALDAFFNQLTTLDIPSTLQSLGTIDLDGNQFTHFDLPSSLQGLRHLNLERNQLTSITLAEGMTNLAFLFLDSNELADIHFPVGLTNLSFIRLGENQLTNLTLPPDLTALTALFLDGNPLTHFALSEPLAATNLAATVAALRDHGVFVVTYPPIAQLTPARQQPMGAARFGLVGPPGTYTVFSSTNLTDWSVLEVTVNTSAGVLILDTNAQFSPHKFYRARQQNIPPNLVFIPGSTFTLGSPTDEVGHRPDESPQTTVTLTRGFWMSKFLVTQREYLALTGSNPGGFPGDLDRPVESVSWYAASNYCATLTAQDLAAGRIPQGTHYRLPTEAEWECAARAGAATRFYYGDDRGASALTNYAWYGANSGFTTQPVGRKLPNAWGLYDMAGNVWEWCQDWYGPYPGGEVTNPEGPASNAIGVKVIRGGAWEASALDCRSARRSFDGASPFITDFIIGFRVVLANR